MKNFFFLLLVFIANLHFCQVISGTLISSEDNSPISYAKIGFENIEKGTFSDEKGNFKIDLTNVDINLKVKIEIAGFQTYENTVKNLIQLNSTKIALNPRFVNFEEVTISSKKYVAKNLGYNSRSKAYI